MILAAAEVKRAAVRPNSIFFVSSFFVGLNESFWRMIPETLCFF